MKFARLAGLVVAAVLATSLVLVSAATAAEPLFNPGTGTLNVLTGTAKLKNSVATITCQESKSAGKIENPHLIKVVLHFLKCEGEQVGKAGPCSVKSTNTTAENLILTETLHAIAGLILPNIPAVLILPTSGKVFVTLAGSCIETTKVTGNTTAEITSPIGVLSSTAKLNLGKEVNTHFISSLGNVLVISELVAFSTTAVEETTANIDWGQLTEVT